MARIARVVAVNLPHHITQRGNNRADVFFDDDDRNYYIKTLIKYCSQFQVKVWAYCLMSNHIHLLAVPKFDFSLARSIGRTNLIYTQYINKKYNRSGRLWQNRFFSCLIDKEEFLWSVTKYIETNPVRNGLVKQAGEYKWSSAGHHIYGKPDLILSEPDWLEPNQREEYRQFLSADQSVELTAIRKATMSGRPLGNQGFIEGIENKLGRILRRRKPGRRKKEYK
jgi:putative transposase